MHNRSLKLASLLFAVAATLVQPPLAAAASPDFSIGASWGATRLQHDAATFDDGSWSSIREDDSDSGWKLFADLRVSRHWAVEIGYADLNGDVDSETTFSAVSDGSGRFAAGEVSVDIDEPTTAYAALVGRLALGDRFTAFAKGGFHAWDADVTTRDSTGSTTLGESGEDGVVGLGVEAALGSRILLRAEIERYFGIVDDDIDIASLGLAVRLGSGR